MFAATVALSALALAARGMDMRAQQFFNELQDIDFDAVEADIIDLMLSSDERFPSDYGNYGPFFIRMAWHCAGTYRAADGEGGCDGARQRFDPERSWVDNTQLDKARLLLEPIKAKYGNGLSWGDLIIFTGTVAIEEMGGPVLGFCAGRLDDIDGSESDVLDLPCDDNGNCSAPAGHVADQLIYVDAGGFRGNPDPVLSVEPIRTTFTRMGMNDSETVALIGGGHAFGKTHGACPLGPGPSPKEQPEDPWPGLCGDGVNNVFTSGFDGPWTTTPTVWTNSFFLALVGLDFELQQSPAGANQFGLVADGPQLTAQNADVNNPERDPIQLLVTDVALLEDPIYLGVVQDFANDIEVLEEAFSNAWYKLVTRDMGPVSRCFGDRTPPVQEFQAELPAPRDSFQRFGILERALRALSEEDALLIESAYLCASTFRASDKHGGCNGARIMLEPERSFPDRVPVISTVDRVAYSAAALSVSKADLIAFAGTEALQRLAGDSVDFVFCPLRSDAENNGLGESLRLFEFEDSIFTQQRQQRLLDLSTIEFVALQARPRSVQYMLDLGYQGSYTKDEVSSLSNLLFNFLIDNRAVLTEVENTEGLEFGAEFTNGAGLFVSREDMNLIFDDDFSAALFELAADNDLFLSVFTRAWTKLMNNDRFSGPVDNQCNNGEVELLSLRTAIFGEDDNGNGNDDNGEDEGNDKEAFIFGLLVGFFIFALYSGCKTGLKSMKNRKELKSVNSKEVGAIEVI